MKTITLEIPDGVELSEHDAAMIVAGKLYEDGVLSGGEAAEFVGISKRDFLETMGKYGYSIFSDNPEDLKHDFKTA